jgi:hypothetical protein
MPESEQKSPGFQTSSVQVELMLALLLCFKLKKTNENRQRVGNNRRQEYDALA